jgi:hypothetical protein
MSEFTKETAKHSVVKLCMRSVSIIIGLLSIEKTTFVSLVEGEAKSKVVFQLTLFLYKKMNRAIPWPKTTARRDSPKLPLIYKMARSDFPIRSSSMVSNPNAEKVVNAPRKPMTKNNCRFSLL